AARSRSSRRSASPGSTASSTSSARWTPHSAPAPERRSLPRVDGGTGFPSADAQDDFSRARRSQLLAELGRRLRREPDDVALILPFDEVVEALGMGGETQLGLQTIPL